MSRHVNAWQNKDIETDLKSLQNVARFKYLRTMLQYYNNIYKVTKRGLLYGSLILFKAESTVFRVPSREGKHYNVWNYNCNWAKCYTVTLREEAGLRMLRKIPG